MGNSDHDTTHRRVGRDDGELRLWHYIYVYSTESSLMMRNSKYLGYEVVRLALCPCKLVLDLPQPRSRDRPAGLGSGFREKCPVFIVCRSLQNQG